ncbi:MAG: protein-tyrosine phosphatase family protein [Parachlamydiales bacterium]|jgi:hypothetical protein
MALPSSSTIHLSQTSAEILLFVGNIHRDGKSITLENALKSDLDQDTKSKLYRAAKEAFVDSKIHLKNNSDDQKAMEILVRAYSILTSKKIGASPKADTWWRKIFGTNELREHARMVKESQKLFKSNFDSYLQATHSRKAQKEIQNGDELLAIVAQNGERIDTYIKEFSPKAQNIWIQLKAQLDLARDPQTFTKDSTVETTLKLCEELYSELATPIDSNDHINCIFTDDRDSGLKAHEKILGFICGKINVRELLNSGNFKLHHSPEIAKTLAQLDNIKDVCQKSPSLKEAYTKLEVALLRQDERQIKDILKQIKNESGQQDFFMVIYNNTQKAFRLLRKFIAGLQTNIFDNDTTRENLKNYSYTQASQTALNGYVETPHADGIDAHTVTIGKNNSVVSAAPKKSSEVKAYFTNLEKNNVRTIVTLHEDYEKGMNNFILFPDEVGETVRHDNVEITLLNKINFSIDSDIHTITQSNIQVIKDGKEFYYTAFKLNNWDEETATVDVEALRKFSWAVNLYGEGGFYDGDKKGHLAITSNNGTGRAATFLMYHEIKYNVDHKHNSDFIDFNSFLSDVIEAHLEFNRVRHGANDEQLAVVVAALNEED